MMLETPALFSVVCFIGLIGLASGCSSDIGSDENGAVDSSGAPPRATSGSGGGAGSQRPLLRFPNNFSYAAVAKSKKIAD